MKHIFSWICLHYGRGDLPLHEEAREKIRKRGQYNNITEYNDCVLSDAVYLAA